MEPVNLAFYYFLAFIIGTVIGSFINVVIYRLPSITLAGIKPGAVQPLSFLAVPLSFCTYCGADIKPWHNIPLISWLMLGGRSTCCKKPISPHYLIVETLGGILAILCVYRFGATLLACLSMLFCWILLAIAWIDGKRFVLPDVIVLPLLWLGLLVNLQFVFFDLNSAVAGAIGGYIFLTTISEGTRILTHKRMIGAGDPKLFAAIAAWLGWQALPGVLLVAAASASIYGVTLLTLSGKSERLFVPFGPHLAFAGIVLLLFGNHIVPIYLQL